MRVGLIVAGLIWALLAASSSAASITRFTTGITNRTQSVTLGADGNVWFTEESSGRIGRITPAGIVTEFATGIPPQGGFGGITSGPDGNVWFVGHAKASDPSGTTWVGRITPAGAVTLFETDPAANRITAGPDGNLWYSTSGINGVPTSGGTFTPSAAAVGRITPAGDITVFRLPSTFDFRGSLYTLGITAGADGSIWTLGRGYSKQLFRIALDGTATAVAASVPGDLTRGPDGAFWVAGEGITRATSGGASTHTSEQELFAFPFSLKTSPMPTSITTGPDGNLWGAAERFVYRLTTGLRSTTYRVLEAKSDPNKEGPGGVTRGSDGNLWFSWGRAIGRLDPSQQTVAISSDAAPTQVKVGADGRGSLRSPRVSCPPGTVACTATVQVLGTETKRRIAPGATANLRFKLARAALARLRKDRRQKARISVYAEHGRGVGGDAAHRHLRATTLVATGLAPAAPGSCPVAAGTVSIASRRGLTCAQALRIARRWLARTGYTAGIDGPPRNGLALNVAGYRCVFRRSRSGDGVTTCSLGAKRITIRVRIS